MLKSLSLLPLSLHGAATATTGERAALASGRSSSGALRLSAGSVVVLAIASGLFAGYLDVGIIVLKRFSVNPEGYYRIARDFPWSVPVVHALTMMIPGLLFAGIVGRSRRRVPIRAVAWLLLTLAIWGALLRLPIYGYGSLLLAAGIATPIARAVAARAGGRWAWRATMLVLLAILGMLALGTTGWQRFVERRALATLPEPPRRRNVILIVWDTVRADHLSAYGYYRPTTPHLNRWAERGVYYHAPIAPAPWTFPSHASFFTGRWPFQTDAQWKPRLDTADPTVAEYLKSKGYQTAGFAANTNCCTYESGLNRGFIHYEDYAMTPSSMLSRTIPGKKIAEVYLTLLGDFNGRKWAALQSRPAAGINAAFLDWLDGRRADRPFFAYLNYFDAHDQYLPPAPFLGRFGIRPSSWRDIQFLLEYMALSKGGNPGRALLMARDCYDDCIAYMDEQLGQLLDTLDRRGLLAETDVIITSDHGEAFAEHYVISHSYSAYLEEIRVPLVMLSPDAKPGHRVFRAVSLRDLPATIVDRAGLSRESPFPGRSLAGYWNLPPGQMPDPPTTLAFTEQCNHTARDLLRPQAGRGGMEPGFQMSLVAWNHHYIRDGEGGEQLFDLIADALERVNLAPSPDHQAMLDDFRATLLQILNDSPGTNAIEQTYLASYRRALGSQVRKKPAEAVAAGRRLGDGRRRPTS